MTKLRTGRREREKSIFERASDPERNYENKGGRGESMYGIMRERLHDSFGDEHKTITAPDKTALGRKEKSPT